MHIFYISAAGEAYNNAFTKKDIEEAIKKWLRRAKERSDMQEKKLAREERDNANNLHI